MIPGRFGTCGFMKKRGGGKEKRALRTTDSAECDRKERDAGELVVPRCNSHSAGGRRAPTMSTSTRCLRSGGRTDTARCEFAPFPSAKKNKRKNKFNQDLSVSSQLSSQHPFNMSSIPFVLRPEKSLFKVHTFTSQQCVQGGCAHNFFFF